jgi:hypothetical protein
MNLTSLLRYVEAKKPRNVRLRYAVIRCFLTQLSHKPILMYCSAASLRSCGLLGGSPAKSSLGLLRTVNCEDAGRCLRQNGPDSADDDSDGASRCEPHGANRYR